MSADEWLQQIFDGKQQLWQQIDRMLETDVISVEAKIEAIRVVTNNYFDQTGKRPSQTQLDRLSAWVLKGKEKEAGIKTERQLRRIWQEKEFCYAQPERREFNGRDDGNRRKRMRTIEI